MFTKTNEPVAPHPSAIQSPALMFPGRGRCISCVWSTSTGCRETRKALLVFQGESWKLKTQRPKGLLWMWHPSSSWKDHSRNWEFDEKFRRFQGSKQRFSGTNRQRAMYSWGCLCWPWPSSSLLSVEAVRGFNSTADMLLLPSCSPFLPLGSFGSVLNPY